ITGARRPALWATLTKCARNGSPESLPRGTALTPREAIPRSCCALARTPVKASACKGSAKACLRVIPSGYPLSLSPGVAASELGALPIAGRRCFQEAPLEKSAQIRGLIIRRGFLHRLDHLQFGAGFLFPAERCISPSQAVVRLDKAGTLADSRALEFHGKLVFASLHGNAARESLYPRVFGRKLEGLLDKRLGVIFPPHAKRAVGQKVVRLGTARAQCDRRLQRLSRLFVVLMSRQNDPVRQPDAGPFRPAIPHFTQQTPGIVGAAGEFERGGFQQQDLAVLRQDAGPLLDHPQRFGCPAPLRQERHCLPV